VRFKRRQYWSSQWGSGYGTFTLDRDVCCERTPVTGATSLLVPGNSRRALSRRRLRPGVDSCVEARDGGPRTFGEQIAVLRGLAGEPGRDIGSLRVIVSVAELIGEIGREVAGAKRRLTGRWARTTWSSTSPGATSKRCSLLSTPWRAGWLSWRPAVDRRFLVDPSSPACYSIVEDVTASWLLAVVAMVSS